MKAGFTGPLIGSCEVAALLGLKPRTVRGRKDRGAILSPHITVKPFKWKQDEVEAWITAGMPNRDEWNALKRDGKTVTNRSQSSKQSSA